jgi:hypothetical protein
MVPAAAAAAVLWKAGLAAPVAACSEVTDGFTEPCAGVIDRPQGGIAGFEPYWVQSYQPSRLWAERYDIVEPLTEIEPGQFFEVIEPQDGPRLRVWDPRQNRLAFIKADTVGPVGKPGWAEHLLGRDGRWIDVRLSVPQHALAMQADLVVRRSLVTAGLNGETKPGSYEILRRVYNETMDSRTVPGLRDRYLLKNVLFTQYFTGDGAAIHYNWWGPPYGFGRPGSHGCLGMMYDDSKFFWEWADLGTPVVIRA